MKIDLKIMHYILSHPKIYSLETRIAHLKERESEFITYGNACLEASGGFQKDIFWWYFEWPDAIKKLTLNKLTMTKNYLIIDKPISIHLMEFVVEIINCAAIAVLF